MPYSTDNFSQIGEIFPQLGLGMLIYSVIFDLLKIGKMFWISNRVNA
jgi:hypothetical protein